MDRRTFLKDSVGLTLTGTAIASTKPVSVRGKQRVSANNRINIAVIGLGNRGRALTQYFLDNPGS